VWETLVLFSRLGNSRCGSSRGARGREHFVLIKKEGTERDWQHNVIT